MTTYLELLDKHIGVGGRAHKQPPCIHFTHRAVLAVNACFESYMWEQIDLGAVRYSRRGLRGVVKRCGKEVTEEVR